MGIALVAVGEGVLGQFMQLALGDVTERWVAEVVGQTGSLDGIGIGSHHQLGGGAGDLLLLGDLLSQAFDVAPTDLGNLQRVAQAVVERNSRPLAR